MQKVLVVDDEPELRADSIAVYAGFATYDASYSSAAPCPLNVFGTQEYLSVKPQVRSAAQAGSERQNSARSR
jgi:hypothetical protein